jgi:hypothetical protein
MIGKVEMQTVRDISNMSGEKTSLSLSRETRDRIANFGKGGESLETCLVRALDLAEECQKKKAGYS